MSAFKINRLTLVIALALVGVNTSVLGTEFNTDVLDSEDKSNIDFSRFSQANYIMPGTYQFMVRMNDQNIAEYPITYSERDNKLDSSEACLSPILLGELGLTPEALAKITYWDDGLCADLSALEGASVHGNLAESVLQLSIPQAWIEYSDPNWIPSSRWDNGVPGVLFDYNVNSTATRQSNGQKTKNSSASGTVGLNAGTWRLRGDYQGSYNQSSGNGNSTQRNFDWSRVYMYRALPTLKATLSMGENYLSSAIFDSWRYVGVNLASDERMLPPSMRGYAPEVVGIAKTNAKVVISQQGRVLYETTVPSGPFRIQDLNSAVSGKLDVRIEEQDGSVQTFQTDTATIPYLTRPGMVQYKIAAGRPSTYDHKIEGPVFASSEYSWGVANSWSLYGGNIFAGNYNAISLGLGRDLYMLGALSADITQSYAQLPDQEKLQGKSWRLSYSKRFDEYDSELTFAGYRFSERNYMSMSEYLDAKYRSTNIGHNKELYTITASKDFRGLGLSSYFSYSHQTYWDKPDDDRFSLSTSTYFDLWSLHNVSLNVSATRSQYETGTDDVIYLSMSLPLGSGSVGFNSQYDGSRYTNNASYYNRIDENNNYRVSTGMTGGDSQHIRTNANGYFTHRGDYANMSLNANYSEGSYNSLGISMQGGATVTPFGSALHAGGINGGTRLLVDTEGVAGIPIDHGHVHTNLFGYGVVTDINSYYRNSTSIDLNAIDDDVEAQKSVVESALTDGAIGYRKFSVVKGAKVLAILSLTDGSHPPFGASVVNNENKELAIVADSGQAWLTGLKGGEMLNVRWNGKNQCTITLPEEIDSTISNLLLPCLPINIRE